MRGPATAGNSKLFKDFCNEAEMEKNNQIVGFILTTSLRGVRTGVSLRAVHYGISNVLPSDTFRGVLTAKTTFPFHLRN